MGLISVVQDFLRTQRDGAHVADVMTDPGTGAAVYAEHYAPSGDDSPPLAGDSVALLESPGTGRVNAVAYADTKNEGVAAMGEVRRYARDPDGAIVGVIWMKGDGTIELGLDPSEWAAVASYVMRELEAVKTDLDAFKTTFDNHIHITTATVGLGPAGTIAPTTTPAPTPHTPEDVASTAVRIQP